MIASSECLPDVPDRDGVVSLAGQQHKDYQGGLDQRERSATWGLQERKVRLREH